MRYTCSAGSFSSVLARLLSRTRPTVLLLCLRASLAVVLLVLLGGSARAQKVELASGITCELIGTYDTLRLNAVLSDEVAAFTDLPALGVSFPQAKYGVKLYRVVYPSVIPELGNRPTLASGLVAIPDSGATQMPVVSYQHGTVFSKTAVPSSPEESFETRLMLAQFAAQGYMVIAADYFGKGQSADWDSYLVKGSTQQACLDLYYAAQAISAALGIEQTALFVSGWSQGGWATLAFLHRLESLGIEVRAAAPMAAPSDLYAAISGWAHAPGARQSFFIPALLMLQVNAYAEYYQLPGLSEVAFAPEYREMALQLYQNTVPWEAAATRLPPSINSLLRKEFIAEGSAVNSRYWQLVQANSVYNWRSVTPIRLYYGQADEIVSPFIATLAAEYQSAAGSADVQAVNAGERVDHRGTFVFGIVEQKKWFDSLLNTDR